LPDYFDVIVTYLSITPRPSPASNFSVFNPESDGHCGFRALAHAIYQDESKYLVVKRQMMMHFRGSEDFYTRHLSYDRDMMFSILSDESVFCPSSKWFCIPECAQLAADTFSKATSFIAADNSCMYVPLGVSLSSDMPIGLILRDLHFLHATFNGDPKTIPWPQINFQHKPICNKLNLIDYSDVFLYNFINLIPLPLPVNVNSANFLISSWHNKQ